MQDQLCAIKGKNGSAKLQLEDAIMTKLTDLVKEHSTEFSDLNQIECAVTEVFQQIRQAVTTKLIEELDQNTCYCACGKKMDIKSRPSRTIIGLTRYTYKRRLFFCEDCMQYVMPLDHKLGIHAHERYTLEVQQAMLLLGQRMPFEEASDYLSKLMKIDVSDQSILTLVESVGKKIASVEKKKTSQKVDSEGQIKKWEPSKTKILGAAYLEMDGSMVPTRDDGWKEVRVGVLFRGKDVVRTDKNHRRILKKRYFSVFNNKKTSLQHFKNRATQEAYDFKFHDYEYPVILADGAKTNWDYAEQYHPYAIQILDYYHASEYLGAAFKSLEFDNDTQKKQTKNRWFDCLWDGEINSIITELLSKSQTKEVQDCIRYYKNNRDRMRYKHYRNLGLEIGSGAIESAHRIVVQCRMKQSGMHWKKSNVQSMVSLRAKYLSGDWDQIIDKYLRAA